jgi:mono/diheme cytochrome c family protein
MARLLLLIFLIGCTKSNKSNEPIAMTETQLVQRGRLVYISNCIACHNSDPKLAGAVGPALHGGSLELLKAKVISGNYPEGHTPQRTTMQMPVFPHLEKDIEALHRFINQQ